MLQEQRQASELAVTGRQCPSAWATTRRSIRCRYSKHIAWIRAGARPRVVAHFLAAMLVGLRRRRGAAQPSAESRSRRSARLDSDADPAGLSLCRIWRRSKQSESFVAACYCMVTLGVVGLQSAVRVERPTPDAGYRARECSTAGLDPSECIGPIVWRSMEIVVCVCQNCSVVGNTDLVALRELLRDHHFDHQRPAHTQDARRRM